jgi:hypothetical protein
LVSPFTDSHRPTSSTTSRSHASTSPSELNVYPAFGLVESVISFFRSLPALAGMLLISLLSPLQPLQSLGSTSLTCFLKPYAPSTSPVSALSVYAHALPRPSFCSASLPQQRTKRTKLTARCSVLPFLFKGEEPVSSLLDAPASCAARSCGRRVPVVGRRSCGPHQ